jgi:hypothetical protein
VREGKDNPLESGSPKETRDDLFKPREHSVEVIGLGVIAALIMAAWPLVSDGSLRLSHYMVFVAFLLVRAGGLVWRFVRLAPNRGAGRCSRNLRAPHANSSRERQLFV